MSGIRLEMYQTLCDAENAEDMKPTPVFSSCVFAGGDDTPAVEKDVPFEEVLMQFIKDNSIPTNPPMYRKEHKEYIIKFLDKVITDAMDVKRLVIDGQEWAYPSKKEKHKKKGKNKTELTVFRYLRPPKNNYNSNLGGITMMFKFVNRGDRKYTPEKDLLDVSFAVANANDNFEKSVGRELCENRMESGDYLTCPYHRNAALVDNLINYLEHASCLDESVKTLQRAIDSGEFI